MNNVAIDVLLAKVKAVLDRPPVTGPLRAR